MYRDMESALSDARRVRAQAVLTKLELGITFLDIAVNTGEPETTRRCIRNAIAALRTANIFLTSQCGPDAEYLWHRRDKLYDRLKEALQERGGERAPHA